MGSGGPDLSPALALAQGYHGQVTTSQLCTSVSPNVHWDDVVSTAGPSLPRRFNQQILKHIPRMSVTVASRDESLLVVIPPTVVNNCFSSTFTELKTLSLEGI